MWDEVASDAVDDVLEDFGSLLSAIPLPPQLGNSLWDFVGMLKIKARTKTSRRLVYFLEKVVEVVEERK